MTFAHDTEVALAAAAALVNTAPGTPDGEDSLQTTEDLRRFLDEQGWTGSRLGDRTELDAELAPVWPATESKLVRWPLTVVAGRAAS